MSWSAVLFPAWVAVTPAQLAQVDKLPEPVGPFSMTVPAKYAAPSAPLPVRCRILDEHGRVVGYRLANCEVGK